MNFQKQLKMLIRREGVSIAQLSRRTGISPKSLYNYLDGRMPRKLDHIKKICDEFQVSSDFLLFGIESSCMHGEDFLSLGHYDVYLKKSSK